MKKPDKPTIRKGLDIVFQIVLKGIYVYINRQAGPSRNRTRGVTTPRGGADILERLEAMASGVSVRPDLAEGLPAYLLLQKTIQSGIETGHWKTGDRLPPERLLAEMAGMSVGTVKKAVLNLVSEGLLYRVRGRGTFVAGSSIARETRRYYLLLRDFDALNERDGTLAPETSSSWTSSPCGPRRRPAGPWACPGARPATSCTACSTTAAVPWCTRSPCCPSP
jgi:DNA-binding transcriptional regulator YhcF (GntR family)